MNAKARARLRPAYFTTWSNLVGCALGLIGYWRGPESFVTCGPFLLGLGVLSLIFHAWPGEETRIADMAAVWAMIGAVVGAAFSPLVSLALAILAASMYVGGWFWARLKFMLESSAILPKVGGGSLGILWAASSDPASPITISLVALVGALLYIALTMRDMAEVEYDAEWLPGMSEDITSEVFATPRGLRASLLHGSWHIFAYAAFFLAAYVAGA